MVVIESVKGTAPSSSEESSSYSNTTAFGYASDGFETASEAALDDDVVEEQPKAEEEEEEEEEEGKEGNDKVEAQVGPRERDSAADDQHQRVEFNQELIHEEKFEDTIKECTKALELNPNYIKVLLRRAEAHEKLEHFEEAIADMTKVLEVDPSYNQARRNIVRLKPLADEKREKMKEEMIGKLKEMGNSILGRFGMSIDNFKAVKDPNTGSYSISFQR